ncbi:TolC family protein [Azoarcus sp. PA01]|nr:TolC family protein [Azoarcus sp. PA01]
MKFPHGAAWRRLLLLVGIAAASPLPAQPLAAHDATAGGFRDAFDAAWQRSVAARAGTARRDEQAARRDAAASWMPAPPNLTVTQRSDRLNRDAGERELEAELELPLWMPGARAAAGALVDAEGEALDARLAGARLRVAGALREAVWALRLAAGETAAAERRVAEAKTLATDVERRVAAGDLARIDANVARSAVQRALARQAEARAALRREQRMYVALTGGAVAPAGDEAAPEVVGAATLDAHPDVVELRRSAALARARLGQARAQTRDAPELILGVTRERERAGERYETTTTIGVRVPFGTDTHNRPRITAANAELVEAETAAALEHERLVAAVDAAAAELSRAHDAERFAAERARLAVDTQQLLAKAFDLGEIDLPTRLRADNERFDAELGVERARLELGRARSRLQQALGLLP